MYQHVDLKLNNEDVEYILPIERKTSMAVPTLTRKDPGASARQWAAVMTHHSLKTEPPQNTSFSFMSTKAACMDRQESKHVVRSKHQLRHKKNTFPHIDLIAS